MFPAGVTHATINIPVVDDNIFEGNENFTVLIDLLSLPSYITILNPSEAVVTILDNDGKLAPLLTYA